jgi:hypothetical protein
MNSSAKMPSNFTENAAFEISEVRMHLVGPGVCDPGYAISAAKSESGPGSAAIDSTSYTEIGNIGKPT